nr:immunoglobulin light chain junction region [Macaca mulatta]MOX33632.1 immunoglobulin light chain junction region [Macaca mulatta]MOX34476.1 immunoglobulin light chain junction region [Macaca mulatta]MOX35291.1 immunoglobulin light chain junction region [Macaca mulatta]MOX35569.1 immunoglobulin light chain junction region [Macaca mulatta]
DYYCSSYATGSTYIF